MIIIIIISFIIILFHFISFSIHPARTPPSPRRGEAYPCLKFRASSIEEEEGNGKGSRRAGVNNTPPRGGGGVPQRPLFPWNLTLFGDPPGTPLRTLGSPFISFKFRF